MTLRIVTCQDGDVTFAFVSGNLALDFAGTLKWRRGIPEELLATPADLARWAVEAGVLTEAPVVSSTDLDRAKQLREAVYRMASAPIEGKPVAVRDLELLNSYAAGQPPKPHLAADHVTFSGTVESVGWAIAWAAAQLVAETPRPIIRECDRTHCTRIFIDRSRTMNRRWCGMQECGNRAKAATYRARKSSTVT